MSSFIQSLSIHRISSVQMLLQHQKRIFLLGLLISSLLAILPLVYSRICNSLSLFNIGLLQVGVLAILFSQFLKHQYQKHEFNIPLTLILALLTGFFLCLGSGYTFIETYIRVQQPIQINTSTAFFTSLTILAGNVFLVYLLSKSTLTTPAAQSEKTSFKFIIQISIWTCVCLLITHLTNTILLDTVLGNLVGVPLLLVAAFIMIDAYWKLLEMA